MARGGFRVGSGRPNGVKNREGLGTLGTTLKEQTPLELVLRIMNDPRQPLARRERMALAALPYCHRRLDLEQKRGKKERALQEAQEAGRGTEWGDLLNRPAGRDE